MMKFLKKHYHWVIAAVFFLAVGIRGGTYNNQSALYLIPVTEALHISRAQFSLAGSACSMVAMLATLTAGALIPRFGYRALLTTFLLIGSCAYALIGNADNYGILLLGYILLGLCNGLCGDVIIVRIIGTWFHKHRGTVLGVISSATGIGGSVLCILQTAIIERTSYRTSLFTSAALFTVCAILVMLLVRNHPSHMGLPPYGDGEKLTHQKRAHEEDHWHGYSMNQLIRRPTFYMMLIGTLLSCILPYLAFYVVVPHLQDRGLSAAEASSMQSILMLCLTGAKILAGYLCDAIGVRKVALLCLGFDVVALILLATTTDLTSALVAIVIYSLALPILTVIIPLLAASLFGYQAQTQYNGIFISMVSAASIVASPISNAVYDQIGSYSPVFFVAAGLTVVLIGMYLLIYRLADKDRKKLEAVEPPI